MNRYDVDFEVRGVVPIDASNIMDASSNARDFIEAFIEGDLEGKVNEIQISDVKEIY